MIIDSIYFTALHHYKEKVHMEKKEKQMAIRKDEYCEDKLY